MSVYVKTAVDELESKIKEYRKTCSNLNECKLLIAKLNVEVDNIKHSWEYDDEDLTFVMLKLNTAISDMAWFQEEEDITLYAVKHAAYRVGKMRSFASAEP